MNIPHFGAVFRFPANTNYGELFEFAHNRIRLKNPEIPQDQFNYLQAPNPGDVRILNPETGLLSRETASYVSDDEPFVATTVAAIKRAKQQGSDTAGQLQEDLTAFLETHAVDAQA